MRLSRDISAVFLAIVLLAAIFAPLIAPYAPNVQHPSDALHGISAGHLLGTDSYGRDVLSRLIWGGRTAVTGAVIAVGVGLLLGVPWGVAAGYWPRVGGAGLMRLADAMLAFPPLVLSVALVGMLGPSLVTSMTSVGIVYAPVLARLTRVGVLAARDSDYVQSARCSGCTRLAILSRHVIPPALGPVIVQATIFTGLAFIIEAAISFLGLGVQPPQADWGAMLADSYKYMLVAPWQVFPPGILIGLVVLATYRLGDQLRNRLATTPEQTPPKKPPSSPERAQRAMARRLLEHGHAGAHAGT